MWNRGKRRGMIPVPLDFSKFDSHMFKEFRIAVTHLLLNVFKHCPELDVIKNKISEIYSNQLLWGPSDSDNYALYQVNNLLGSGVANTQADGSTLNMTLQCYMAEILGFEQPDDLGLTLGDDVVMWIPDEIFNRYGYEGLLTVMDECLKPLNMKIHVKKKYPNPQIMFLQRLYVPDQGIIGEYSLVRSVDSII